MSTDKPANDTHFLKHGHELVSSKWTRGNWKPGDILGENGPDDAAKKESPSYADPARRNELSERRSATSTGHIIMHPRPASVCLGWGGYDKYTDWQSYGRRIDRKWVEMEGWSKDRQAPVNFVDESDKVVETIKSPFKKEDLPSRPQDPLELYEALHKR